MEILLIRHSITAGNLARRYVGRTDESLCPEGRALAEKSAAHLPEPNTVYSSPMLRCLETAEILFPGKAVKSINGFRETDFGRFEYKTYDELKNDESYRAWLDSSGALAPPDGESRDEVKARVLSAFDSVLRETSARAGLAAIVAHGGTIMTLMHALALPEREYYDWQVKNCQGFLVSPENGRLRLVREV